MLFLSLFLCINSFGFEREPKKDFLITTQDLAHVETPTYSETVVEDTHKFITKKVWLLSNTLDAFFTDAEINESKNPGNGWETTFQQLFGMDVDKFYKDFDAFMLKDREEQLLILPTNEELQNLTFSK